MTCPDCHWPMKPVPIVGYEEFRFGCHRCGGAMLKHGKFWYHHTGKPVCPDTYDGLQGLFGFSAAPQELPAD